MQWCRGYIHSTHSAQRRLKIYVQEVLLLQIYKIINIVLWGISWRAPNILLLKQYDIF